MVGMDGFKDSTDIAIRKATNGGHKGEKLRSFGEVLECG